MDAPGPSRTPVNERVTLYCTWRPSALTTRPRKQVPLEVFIQRNFVADIFRQKLNFTGTNSDIAFLCHPLGDLGVTYTVHLWLVGKRVVDLL